MTNWLSTNPLNENKPWFHVYAEDGFESAHRSERAARSAARRGSTRRRVAYEVVMTDVLGQSGGGYGRTLARYVDGIEQIQPNSSAYAR
jgi:hypothetical protein